MALEDDGTDSPNPHRQDTLMADTKLEQKLVDYLQDMHALERAGQRQIVSMLETEKNETILRDFRTHQQETDRHVELLEGCLVAHGESSATRKEIQTLVGATAKGALDKIRGDQEGKNVRDTYVAKHAEIAGYQLLERLAKRAGDEHTADVARTIRSEEIAMVQRIDQHWDLVIDQTLIDNGIEVPA